MDVITGKTRPQSGRAIYDQSTDLTTLDPIAIARQGWSEISKATVFEALTVEENPELALKMINLSGVLYRRLSGEQRDRIDEVLALLRLGNERPAAPVCFRMGKTVSRNWHAAGTGAAFLLLLDEPAAGMTDAETEYTAELFRQLAGKHSLMVVEHDMGFVRNHRRSRHSITSRTCPRSGESA